MFENSQLVIDAVKYVLTLALGAGGLKIIEMIFNRRKQNKEGDKIGAEAQHISQTNLNATLQIADANLQNWMTIANKATQDLLLVTRDLNRIEIVCDDLTDLLQECSKILTECKVKGCEQLQLEIARLLAEREKNVRKGKTNET